MGVNIVKLRCIEVIREISNYLDGETAEQLRSSMEAHLEGCAHCTAIMDGTRNVITLFADGRTLEVPAEFSARLFERFQDHARKNPQSM